MSRPWRGQVEPIKSVTAPLPPDDVKRVLDDDTRVALQIHGVDVGEIERRILASPWLTDLLAAARAEEREAALGEASDVAHTEARWQQEMVFRRSDDRLLRSYTVERLLVVECILRALLPAAESREGDE